MNVKQIYQLTNDAIKEITGREDLLQEDLSNVVEVGTELFKATDYDHYVKALVNKIGRTIFVNRKYSGEAPSVLKDGWEYGSVLEKISAEMPQAVENESWQLEDGTSYDPNIFNAPKVSVKFFNKRTTFEIDMSVTELQVKESFTSAQALNGFISMLYNNVDKAMTARMDALVKRTINNFIGETLASEYPTADYANSSGVRAINLLKLYNDSHAVALTTANALTTPDFIRFATAEIKKVSSRMRSLSVLFNIGGKERFTPTDLQHIVLHADFDANAIAYLQSDTFHKDLISLPTHEIVSYWQGTGKKFEWGSTSKINVKTASDGKVVELANIIGVIFDNDALGVNNFNKRVTTNYNAKAEFWNNFYKEDAQYFNDLNENFVVFFMA